MHEQPPSETRAFISELNPLWRSTQRIMSSEKVDKRIDGGAPSATPSPLRRRSGRDASAWEDLELFGEDEGEARETEAPRDGRAGVEGLKTKRKGGQLGEFLGKERRPMNTGLSATLLNGLESCLGGRICFIMIYRGALGGAAMCFLDVWYVGSTAPSDSDEAADAEAAPAPEPPQSRAQRKRRQPPLDASSFLMNSDGSANDGLLSMYCNLNYAKDKLHKFKFLDRQESRDARKEEFRKDLQAAQEFLDMKSCRERRSNESPNSRSDGQQSRKEVLRLSVIVKTKKKQLARLAAEERVDLRDDLNTLLSEIRGGILACYPYNEHLSRLSRRLGKISTQPELWAKYRPRLVQLHTTGFLRKWEDAGCPANPHILLLPGATEWQGAAQERSNDAQDNAPPAHESTFEEAEQQYSFQEPSDWHAERELLHEGEGKTFTAAKENVTPQELDGKLHSGVQAQIPLSGIATLIMDKQPPTEGLPLELKLIMRHMQTVGFAEQDVLLMRSVGFQALRQSSSRS